MIDSDAVKRIEDLHRLKTEGVITEAEFEKAKQGLLDGGTKPTPRAVAPKDPSALPAETDYLGWALLPVRRYAQFEGRSSRKEFWLYMLAANVAFGVLALVALADTDIYGDTGSIGGMLFGIVALGILGLLIPTIAVQVRRFRDQDKSPWLVLLNAIPYVGALVVLIFMALAGTRGENRFGPDPKG